MCNTPKYFQIVINQNFIIKGREEGCEEYIKNLAVPVYNHSKITVKNAIEDYFILGFTSPTTGISIRTRMIYIEKKLR